MCILFIALNCHADYPLIIAANRDEFFGRPSRPMHYWDDQPQILAGRDLQAGGSWLGVNRHGSFAAVTNFRKPGGSRDDALSRGQLVSMWLNNRATRSSFLDHLQSRHQDYNPFNLVFGDPDEVLVWDHLRQSTHTLEPGFHSVSNGAIDQPWPKMARGVAELRRYIERSAEICDSELIKIMQDGTRAPLNQLPDTGVDQDTEQALSSIFIEGDRYGTRATTIVLFGKSQIKVTEVNYLAGGKTGELQRFTLEQEVEPGNNLQQSMTN